MALAKGVLAQTHTRVTDQEKARFQRALYRLEIYCDFLREAKEIQFVYCPDLKNLFFSGLCCLGDWANRLRP